jgi:glycine betaine/proline transport system substrate-binding protein
MKQLMKRFVAALAATLLLASGAQAADIVIGSPNWVSVNGTAHIVKTVLEDTLGLEVEIQNGSNPVVFEAMDKGSMHVHPEVWLPNQDNLYKTYVVEKGTVLMNPNSVISFQGICVPDKVAEEHGITKISDLTNPDVAKLFDLDGNGKGEVWIGATGWASTNVEKIRAKSYGYNQTLDLLEMDETLALANVDAAINQNKPIVFFCYTPHHMFSLYDLTVLEEPAYDEDKWIVLQPTDDPDWLEKSSAGVAWKNANLHILYAKTLETDYPEAATLLSKIKLNTQQVSELTYEITVNKMDPADFARRFVDENADLVDEWLK